MIRFTHAVLLILLFAASAAAHAAVYTLSGGPSPSAALGNDDVITVYVNNIQVGSGGCCNSPPITFNANPGDALRITVVDTYGGCHGVNPLYLHNMSGASITTTLDPVGVPNICDSAPPTNIPFYDRTFTVPAISSIPTLSEWGKFILSGLLALGAVFILRRRRQ
jgi:hypothetical protein